MKTPSDVAAEFAVDADTVRGWIVSGRLLAINTAAPGKRACYRIEQEAIDEFKSRSAIVKLPIKRRKKRLEPRRQWFA